MLIFQVFGLTYYNYNKSIIEKSKKKKKKTPEKVYRKGRLTNTDQTLVENCIMK